MTAPGEVFASLAASVIRAHIRATVRRRLCTAQAWVRLRELVRKAANRRFERLGSALWLQAFVFRRRREAGDEPAINVRLMHQEVMGNEWGVDIAVFLSETASSVRAYALGMLAYGDLIPGRLMCAAVSEASSPPDRRAEPPPVLETDPTKSQLVDAKQTKDTERRMSKAGLTSFMRDQGLAHGDA